MSKVPGSDHLARMTAVATSIYLGFRYFTKPEPVSTEQKYFVERHGWTDNANP